MRATDTINGPRYQYALAKSAPIISAERERTLARRWRLQGDRRAADELVRTHLRTVTTLATKYRHYGVPISELVAEGNCGLVHALGRFDPERGVRFATYATHWVRAYILGYVLRTWSIVGGSSGGMRSQLFFKFRRERARLTATLGDLDSEEVQEILARRLGVSLDRIRLMMRRVDAQDISLDTASSNDSPTPMVDQLLHAGCDPEQELLATRFQGRVSEVVKVALRVLDPRERYIVGARVMAPDEEALSLADMSRVLGISRERVRQLEVRAFRKLKAAVSGSRDPVVTEWALSG
jgi:RNA polymerase sigma-32 factor